MSVIGRLDSQVNDVLIEPLGGRRRRDERDPHAATDDAQPAATNEARGEATGTGDKAHDDTRARVRRDERLPVWLL